MLWDACRRVLVVLPIAGLLLSGCASPGPPRSPSLNLPGLVSDLTAVRRGDTVELRFAIPQRNTDHLPLRGATVSAQLCRAVEVGACVPISARQSFATSGGSGVMRDELPAILATGAPRTIAYRVSLYNESGHSAGYSDAVYAAGGAAPAAVEGLSLQGSRLGVVVSWKPIAGDRSHVVLRREDMAPKPRSDKAVPALKAAPARVEGRMVPAASRMKPEDADVNAIWLSTAPPEPFLTEVAPGETAATPVQTPSTVLDDTAVAGEPYVYMAERRASVKIGGRVLEVRSVASGPVAITLRAVYPPPAPTDLTGASFATARGVGVDLIWQPVEDPHLAGYNVYRQAADGSGLGTKLNAAPVTEPGFHDVVQVAGRYRYSVKSVDEHGNESAACTFVLEPGL